MTPSSSKQEPLLPKSDFEGYHHTISFWLALGSAFFQTVVFAIVIPTATAYVTLLGQGRWFAGGISALAAFIPAITAPVWRRVEKKLSLKHCFQILSMFQIIGTFLWTLGFVADTAYILLVSRIFSGLGSPANCYASYINRGVSTSKKTSATKMAASIFGSAYAFGALLAFLLTLLGKEFPVSNQSDSLAAKWFNEYTYPGWICCFFYMCYLIGVLTVFVEPPKYEEEEGSSSNKLDVEDGTTDPASTTTKREKKYLFCLAYSIFAFAFCYTGVFSFTVSSVMAISGLDLMYATLFLAVLMTVNTLATLSSDLIKDTSDRKVLVCGWGALLLITPLGYIAINEDLIGGLGEVNGIAWGALSIFFSIFACVIALLNLVRAATLALSVKVPHPADRDLVISIVPAFCFMMATAAGSMVGLALEAWAMLLIIIIFVVSAFSITLWSYQYLEVKDTDEVQGTINDTHWLLDGDCTGNDNDCTDIDI